MHLLVKRNSDAIKMDGTTIKLTTDRRYCVIPNVASVIGEPAALWCDCATRFKGPTGAYYVLTLNANMI